VLGCRRRAHPEAVVIATASRRYHIPHHVPSGLADGLVDGSGQAAANTGLTCVAVTPATRIGGSAIQGFSASSPRLRSGMVRRLIYCPDVCANRAVDCRQAMSMVTAYDELVEYDGSAARRAWRVRGANGMLVRLLPHAARAVKYVARTAR
jgi:hypothetical protein